MESPQTIPELQCLWKLQTSGGYKMNLVQSSLPQSEICLEILQWKYRQRRSQELYQFGWTGLD
jgi:hypothetical protein